MGKVVPLYEDEAVAESAASRSSKEEELSMRIVDGAHAIPGISWSRAYLIEDDTLALVDAGLPWNAGAVVRYVESIGRKLEEIKVDPIIKTARGLN